MLYSSLSTEEKTIGWALFSMISKSKERVEMSDRAKFTLSISSNRIYMGGLCT